MGTVIGVRDPRSIKNVKTALEKAGALDKSRKISATNGVSYLYSTGSIAEMRSLLESHLDDIELEEEVTLEGEKDSVQLGKLESVVAEIVGKSNVELLATVPKKWSLYPPMVLFHSGQFDSPAWESYFEAHGKEGLFSHLSTNFFRGYTHFAVNKPIIESDVMRRPFSLVPLYGDFGPEPTDSMFDDPQASDFQEAFWCTVVQNGIHQEWAPRYTMFSRGNIKEKRRILDTYKDLEGQNVVDLYAGIGYFTFSYLANGATLFCWELNPWSIEGLLRGLRKNGCKFRLTKHNESFDNDTYSAEIQNGTRAFVFHESNEFAPDRLASLPLYFAHYNLGLLPSSKQGWGVVGRLAGKKSEGQTDNASAPPGHPNRALVHAHENVHKDDFAAVQQDIERFFGGEAVHLEKVKTFAPDIWHVVVDVLLPTAE